MNLCIYYNSRVFNNLFKNSCFLYYLFWTLVDLLGVQKSGKRCKSLALTLHSFLFPRIFWAIHFFAWIWRFLKITQNVHRKILEKISFDFFLSPIIIQILINFSITPSPHFYVPFHFPQKILRIFLWIFTLVVGQRRRARGRLVWGGHWEILGWCGAWPQDVV